MVNCLDILGIEDGEILVLGVLIDSRMAEVGATQEQKIQAQSRAF